MEPNKLLAEIRDFCQQDRRSELARDDVGVLLDRIEALDQQLVKGGPLPDDWNVRPGKATR